MTERLLITGASGFVGRAVLDQPIDGYEVHAVARSIPADAPAQVTWHGADLLVADPDELIRTVAPSHLLHLAWIATPGVYPTSPENRQWVDASARLVEAFASAGGLRVVATGTCMEYDLSETPSREDTPTAPNSLYASCKEALFRRSQEAAQSNHFELAWARLFYLYGPREQPGRLVPSLVTQLLAGERATVGAGSLKRDYLHVHDVARALLHLVGEDVTGAVNVGSGRAASLGSIGKMVAAACDAADLLTIEDRPGEGPDAVPEIVADTTKLTATGWSAQTSLEEGIRATVNWWKQGRGLS